MFKMVVNFNVNLGSQDPSIHGVLSLLLRFSGETVVQTYSHIGLLHCGTTLSLYIRGTLVYLDGNFYYDYPTELSYFAKNSTISVDRFIGFSEAECSFTGGKVYPQFTITQGISGLSLLVLIQLTLGFGAIYQTTSKTDFVFVVGDRKNMSKLIDIFNGNLRLLKTRKRFKLWLKKFNKAYKTSIKLLPWTKEPNLTDGWLSSFNDGDGCYSCNFGAPRIQNKTGNVLFSVSPVWRISQSELNIIKKIMALFPGSHYYFQKTEKEDHWVVTTTKMSVTAQVIKYFTKFPSFHPEKIVSYKYWIIIYNKVAAKEHLTPAGLTEIKKLEKYINVSAKARRKKRNKNKIYQKTSLAQRIRASVF